MLVDDIVDRPVLAPYVELIRGRKLRGGRTRLGGKGKAVAITARVRSEGSIVVKGVAGRKFNSPSMAARHVLGHNANG